MLEDGRELLLRKILVELDVGEIVVGYVEQVLQLVLLYQTVPVAVEMPVNTLHYQLHLLRLYRNVLKIKLFENFLDTAVKLKTVSVN